jgi:hypothetical protein
MSVLALLLRRAACTPGAATPCVPREPAPAARGPARGEARETRRPAANAPRGRRT